MDLGTLGKLMTLMNAKNGENKSPLTLSIKYNKFKTGHVHKIKSDH